MKKYLALSSILSMLGALSVGTPQALAYRLDVVSNENILHHETLLDKLEKYEAEALAKLAAALKDTKIDPDSMVTLALSLDGSIHGITYKDPGTAIQADSPARKALKEVRSMQFGKIPLLESGYIKMSLPFKELVDGNYKRKLYVVQTPEGQSIGGVGGISISGVNGNISARETGLPIRPIIARQKKTEPVPYSDKDRKFDNEIASIYSSLKNRPTSFVPSIDDKSNIKDIEAESQNYLKQANYLAAVISYLSEAKYYLNTSDLQQVKARFEKAKNLFSKLQIQEKNDFLVKAVSLSASLTGGNENFSSREYLLLETCNLAKTYRDIDTDIRLQVMQALADLYLSAGQTGDALNYYKQMLAEAIKAKIGLDRVAHIYTKIAATQKSMKDAAASDKTLLEASRYLEKEGGKDSVSLIPIYLMIMQNTTDEKTVLDKVDRIDNIVDKYRQTPLNPRVMIRDTDARIACNLLMSYSRNAKYKRYNDPSSSFQTGISAQCARIGYKLKLKSEPRFDYFSFRQVIDSMQDAGQYEQAANLCKETIAMLESSSERSDKIHLEAIRGIYLKELEFANKTDEAEKVKADVKAKEEIRFADDIKRLEDRFNDTSEFSRARRIQLEAGLIALYAKQKNASKTNEFLSKILIDLKAIDGNTKELDSLGFSLVGPVRTQPEFFQENQKMEEMLIRAILLLDEKSKSGLDSMSMNTLTLRTMGSDKNELARKVAKAIEEARQGRAGTNEKDKSALLDTQITAARNNRDYAELARLKKEKLNSMMLQHQPNFVLVSEFFNLSQVYSEANEPKEAENAFRQALAFIDSGKPSDNMRIESYLSSAASYQMRKNRYDLAETGFKKYIDLVANHQDSDTNSFYRHPDIDSLNRAYIQNGDFDKAINFQCYVLNKLESSPHPLKKMIWQERLSLSTLLLRIANRDTTRKDALKKQSETEFNKALSEMVSYYGPKSEQVRRAISDRMSDLKPDDLQAIESLKKLQDRN